MKRGKLYSKGSRGVDNVCDLMVPRKGSVGGRGVSICSMDVIVLLLSLSAFVVARVTIPVCTLLVITSVLFHSYCPSLTLLPDIRYGFLL